MTIIAGDLDNSQVCALLEHHATTARAETARGSAHALDLASLKASDINVWAAWDCDTLLAVGALKRLSIDHGEIKSMHTAQACRRKGVGTAMLLHIVEAARAMGLSRLSLETGPGRTFYLPVNFISAMDFASARRSGNTFRIQTVSS